MNTPHLTILMATYNGEEFIREQLDSLLNQTYTNWTLLIRDDGSADKTVEIVKDYITRYKNISLMVNDTDLKGACANFAALFRMAQKNDAVDYIMFCDQDDIWKPGKISKSIGTMLALEADAPGEPVLIYSDFELMDNDGNFISGAFKLKHRLYLRNLISFNFVYGCTTMINRPLMNKINEIPVYAINHDYWIALVASIYKSGFINDKLLRYRQHSRNASGNVAGNNGLTARLNRNFLKPQKEILSLQIRLRMLASFYHQYETFLAPADRKVLADYLQSFKKNRLKVIYIMLKEKIFRNGLFQTAVSFFQVLLFFNKIDEKRG